MNEQLRTAHARIVKLGADILNQRRWGDSIFAEDAKRQDDALAALGYEAGQIAKLLAAPAQPEPKVTSPSQSHQPMGEPVAQYQYRNRLRWNDNEGWSAWKECSKAQYELCLVHPILDGFEREARALFAHPPAASTPAVPDTPTTSTESEAYLAGFADCAAARAAAPVEGAAQGWISVEDRLPEPNVEVLCAGQGWADAFVMACYYDEEEEGWWGVGYHCTDAVNRQQYPSHWMPFPPPPAAPKEKP